LHDVVDSMSSLSKIAPTFGQIGGGVQFELPDNVSCLIKNGFLKGYNGKEWIILKEFKMNQIGLLMKQGFMK